MKKKFLNKDIVRILRYYYSDTKYIEDAEKWAKRERSKRISIIKKYIDLSDTMKTLEVGAGSGVHKNDFPNWVGLDISFPALRSISKPYAGVVCAMAEKLPFKSESFDLVVAFNLIEHLYFPKEAIDEMIRVTKKEVLLSLIVLGYIRQK